MKGIKSFLIILIIFLFVPNVNIFNVNKANAESNKYLRVINQTTPFCLDEYASTPLFFLPYTFYVRVISTSSYSVHIECYGNGTTKIDGYVPLNTLFDDGLSTTSPYLDYKITTISSTPLYSDFEQNNRIMFIFPERQLNYYGKIENSLNKVMYFVGYGDQLGYVSEDALLPFNLPLHPNELTFLEKDEPTINQPTTTPEGDDFFSLKIVIIILLIFAGIIAVFVAFTGKSRKNTNTIYYDENDYE